MSNAWIPHVGSYRRRMPVSLKRMYENALDWEHLPWLHSSSFKSINCIDSGDWGWRAEAVLADTDSSMMPSAQLWKAAFKKSLRHQPLSLLKFGGSLAKQTIAVKRGGAKVLLELRLDRDRRRWITKTLSGVGVGTEIWTHVIEHGNNDIEVVVDFFVPNIPRPMAAPLGQYYQALYKKLYDEDQEMMELRQQALDNRRKTSSDQTELVLGSLEEIKAQLPLVVSFAGREWRLLEYNDQFAIHQTLCPHMLGPLSNGNITKTGAVECPWHGYQFDLITGKNMTGQRCKLAKPPVISINENIVTLTKV